MSCVKLSVAGHMLRLFAPLLTLTKDNTNLWLDYMYTYLQNRANMCLQKQRRYTHHDERKDKEDP